MSDIISKTEIESHSAYLTNQRIDKFIITLHLLMAEVESSRLNPELSMSFWGAVLSLFNQTHYVYAVKENELIKNEIDNCIINANLLNGKLQYTEKFIKEDILNLNQYCKRASYLMIQGLQNLRYFLRLGKSEPQGIDSALEIFKLDIWKKRESKKEKEEKDDTSEV